MIDTEYISPRVCVFAVVLIVFAVYLSTAADGVTWGNYGSDSGELIAAAWTLGIPHPTGYPLFALLGRVFSFVPLGSVGFRITLLSCAAAAAACGLACMVMYRLTRCLPAAVGGALALGLSRTVWSQASITEVYPLHLLLMSCLLAALFGAEKEPSVFKPTHPGPRRLCLVLFLLGLGFSNHMTTILIVPTVLFWLVAAYWRCGSRKLLVKHCGFAVLFFAIGLLVYLYLPLRGASGPVVEMGPSTTFGGLFSHVSGKQFRGWMFSRSAPEVKFFFQEYRILHQFSIFGGLVGTLGAWEMFRRSPAYFIPLGALFLTDLLYAVNYNIPDIEPYFIPSYLVFSIWLAYGITVFLTSTWSRWKSGWWTTAWRRVAAAIGLVLIIYLPCHAYLRYVTVVREARRPAARLYGHRVFKRVPSNGVVLSIGTGETFSLWHYQACSAAAKRKGIRIFLRTYFAFPWYIEKLKRENPALDIEPVMAYARDYQGTWNDIDYIKYRARLNRLTMAFIDANFDRCKLFFTSKQLFDSDAYFLAQAGEVYQVMKR